MTEEKELGIITRTFLGVEDHGMFTFVLDFDFGGHGQGFGTYDIEGKQGAEVIRRILEAVGVDSWEELEGHEMYVTRTDGLIRGIEAPAYRKNTKPFNIVEFFKKKRAKP